MPRRRPFGALCLAAVSSPERSSLLRLTMAIPKPVSNRQDTMLAVRTSRGSTLVAALAAATTVISTASPPSTMPAPTGRTRLQPPFAAAWSTTTLLGFCATFCR